MAYGRGGVGNIQALEQETARVAADLEANQQAAGASSQYNALPGKEEPKFAHTGRGGMGNYYSPEELSQTGHFSDAHRSHIPGDGTQQPPTEPGRESTGPPSYSTTQASAAPTRMVGRGGAGNFSFGVSESEERAARKRMADEKKREVLTGEIEKGVKEQLAVPPKAKLSGVEQNWAT